MFAGGVPNEKEPRTARRAVLRANLIARYFIRQRAARRV